MTAPAISVVIPAYKAAGTLAQVLDSVWRQTVAPAEVIMVDDASPDDTFAVGQALLRGRGSFAGATGAEVETCRAIRLPENRGPAGARNAGVREARGEWIAFLDGDDAWLPWRLEDQMQVMALAPRATLLAGDLALMGSAGAGVARSPWAAAGRPSAALRWVQPVDFVDENPVPTSTVLARRQALLEVGGFDERFRGPEDIDLWMRMSAAGDVVKLGAPLALYRERPGSLSMDQDRFLPQIRGVYAKAFADGGALHAYRHLYRRALAGRYVSAAWAYGVSGRRGRAAALILRSWLLWPRRLKVEQRRPAWRLRMLASVLLNRH